MAKTNSLDDCLSETLKEIGEFGRYQIIVIILLCTSVVCKTIPHIAFIFVTGNLDYRCKIPECEGLQTEYEPPWLKDAVPYDGNIPKSCEKYHFINLTNKNGECSPDQFDRGVIEYCDDFVYKTDAETILIDYNLQCQENRWKLTLVGTINSLGQFIGIPSAGFLSDRYGRLTVLIIGTMGCGIFGIARAFSNTYILFLTLEFLDALFLSGTFACCFILSIELVDPEKRILALSLNYYSFTVGEVITASIAWLIPKWRTLLLVFYSPLFLFISYVWITPESVRWLLSQGKYKRAQKILIRAAKINNREISQNTLDKLAHATNVEEKQQFFMVFKSRILVLRLISACFCWITCAFLFYGLSINSMALAENIYLNFILVALIEIPAFASTYIMVDKIGRRFNLCLSYLITAISCFVFIFIDRDQYILTICLYLLGKFGATASFATLYILSSEIFPTPLRQSLMGICSMFARIGSMVSPQVPLLSAMWTPLPLVLFSGMASTAAILCLSFPETLKLKLPDTIEEAEDIGRKNEIL